MIFLILEANLPSQTSQENREADPAVVQDQEAGREEVEVGHDEV